MRTDLDELSLEIYKMSLPYDICPICGGRLELYPDGFEYCDCCEYNTKDE